MCSKVRYASRKLAKQSARKTSTQGVHAYRCTEPDCMGLWHIGHMPASIRSGTRTRQQVYGT